MKRILIAFLLMVSAAISLAVAKSSPAYKDASLPVEARIDDLLHRMTVLEKARQLDMYAGHEIVVNKQLDLEKIDEIIGADGMGSLHDLYPETAELANRIQKYMTTETRLGIPALFIEEALHGYGGAGSTCFPAPIGLGTMWDTELMEKIGRAIGTETRAHGVHFVLSPVLGLAWEPRWGRVEETYGEDPYLAAQTGLAMINGMQGDDFKDPSSIVSEPKHYAIHSIPECGNNAAPVRIGEREARETFLYVFETAVRKGNAHGIMAAYHEWDGIPMTAHSFLLKELLRDEWGFQGMVVADLGALARLRSEHRVADTPEDAIVTSIKAGLDMQFYDYPHDIFQTAIVDAIDSGSLTMDELDRAVRCVLRVKFLLGLFENPYTDTSLIAKSHHSEAHQALALEAGRKSICLLKNENNLLPFSKDISSVAVIGNLADKPAVGGYSPRGVSVVTLLDGIREKLGENVEVHFEAGVRPIERLTIIESRYLHTPDNKHSGLLAEYFNNPDLRGEPDFTQVETHMAPYYHNNSPGGGISPDYFSVRWTGTITAPATGLYEIGIITDDKGRLFVNDELLVDNWDPFELNVMMTQEVQLIAGKPVPIRMEFGEEIEHAGIRLKWRMLEKDPNANTAQLDKVVAAVEKSDIAVLVLGESHEDVGEGKDRSNLNLNEAQMDVVKAVYSTGKPVAAVLLNGRPLTINWLAEHAPAIVEAWFPGEAGGTAIADVLFGDYNPSGKLPVSIPESVGQLPVFYSHKLTGRGSYVDGGSAPLYPFGHGLSYTSFEYSNLRIEPAAIPIDGHATISVDITNTGDRSGTEIVQLYINDMISSVTTPKIELKGFARAELNPGETQTVSMELTPEHLALWNAEMKEVVEPGEFEIMVGASCRDIRLKGLLEVK